MTMVVRQPATGIDPLTLEVIRNRLDVIAQEMQLALVRSSFSCVIKEAWDCACALFDTKGETVAQAKSLPIHLGTLVASVNRILQDYPLGIGMQEGDAYIFNDPYEGGTHIPDLTVVVPIVWNGRTVALACIMAHQQDFGGMTIGTMAPDATEIFQEGLILPPCKLMSKGEWNRDVVGIILKNVRMPRQLMGDLRAMMAAGEVGKRRYQELCRGLGADVLQRYVEELKDRAEFLTRQKIAEIPEGTYRFHDFLDNDGIDLDRRVKIQVAVGRRGSDLVIDFDGTDPQLKGPANSARSGPPCCGYYVIRCITDPAIPNNGGCFRPIALSMPEGTLLNPRHPAPLNARSMTLARIADTIFGALVQAIPTRVRAASASMMGISLSGQRPDGSGYYVYMELACGGMGARPSKDGIDYIEGDMANTMNTPVEAVETEYPLRIHYAKLRDDSGGPGRYRGGLGMEKEFEVLEGECEVTHRGDRHFTQPWGLFGGRPGASWSTTVHRMDGSSFKVPARMRFLLRPGDRMRVLTGGGGGYGDPLQRPAGQVREDVLDRKITEETTRKEYGVVVMPDTGAVDIQATAALRAQMQSLRGPITWTFDRGGDLGRE